MSVWAFRIELQDANMIPSDSNFISFFIELAYQISAFQVVQTTMDRL